MSHTSPLLNHQIRLAARPVGLPQATDWLHTSEPVADPADGGVLVQTLALSLDPYPRKPDAELPAAATDPEPSPFAALAALRRKN